MSRKILYLLFVVILLVLSFYLWKNCHRENPNVCIAEPVEPGMAENDSLHYKTFIDTVKIPSSPIVENARQNSFPIPQKAVINLKDWEEKGWILPDAGSSDKAWIMFDQETDKNLGSKIISFYFVCYKNIKGKRGPLVFIRINDSGSIDSVKTSIAKSNIEAQKNYLSKLSDNDEIIFYPYGFLFPWCDFLSIAARSENPNSKLNGVFVIKKDKNEVDFFIHAFESAASGGKMANDDGDGGAYYDFTNPCPTSCPY